jgi:hypothetical protein
MELEDKMILYRRKIEALNTNEAVAHFKRVFFRQTRLRGCFG